MNTLTQNGEPALSGSGSKTIDLFYNIGSARNAQERVEQLFNSALQENPKVTAAILAWSRDVRGGAGERQTFRNLVRKMTKKNKKYAEKLLRVTTQIGRFDDLRAGLNTPLENVALEEWIKGLDANNELAFKWVNIKKDNLLRKKLGLNHKNFRKKIVAGRPSIIERKMCEKKWGEIPYEHVPSVCLKKNAEAFRKNDGSRFDSWLNKDETEVNASALFPYQILQTCIEGDRALANKQWEALNIPVSANIIPMVDTSSSMNCPASKGVSCMEVAISLGAYLAQNNNGTFKNKLLNFNSDSHITTLKGKNADEIFREVNRLPWGGSTNFQSAYMSILNEAIVAKIPQEDMPEYMVVLSDMQFNEATNNYGWGNGEVPSFGTAFEKAKTAFENAGYVIPKVVFWNLNAQYDNFPSCSTENGVALVSGFSPFVMKAIADAKLDAITPEGIMETAIEKYVKLIENA